MIENYPKEAGKMNKFALAALGIGAVYFMQNKNARDQLMKQVESVTGMTMKASQNAEPNSSSSAE